MAYRARADAAAAAPGLPTRGLLIQWLQSLHVLTDPGDQPLAQRLVLIAERGGADGPTITLPDPPGPHDLDRLLRVIQVTNRLRGLEHGAHALVTAVLLHWLSEATGRTEAEILTELAATLDTMAFPHEPSLVTDPG